MLKKNMVYCVISILALALTSGCDIFGGGGGGGGNDDVRGADGLGNFLWKPTSESNGRLVVLFPTEFRGRHVGAAVHNGNPPKAGNKLEDGVFTTDSHNGNRVHYRFPKPGAAYGNNVYATLYLNDGTTVSWYIPVGAARTD